MSGPSSLVRHASLLAIVLLLPLLPETALAQGQGNGGKGGGPDDPPVEALTETDSIPPEVHIQPSGGTFADSLLDVTIYWCDDLSLDASSRTIKHGITGVVGDFTYASVGFAEPCNLQGVTYKSEGEINLSSATTLTATIKDDYGNSGSDNASYTYEPEIPPTVWTTPMNEGYRNTSIEAAAGFEMVVSHSTPGYTFKGKHRGLTFVYRSGAVDPTILVQVDVSSGGADPDKFSMKVKDPSNADMTFLNNDATELFWDGTTSTVRLGGVVDASGLGTGAHDLTILVRSHFGGSYEETTKTVRALVVDESGSPYGEGWTIAGIQTAHEQADNSVLITEGNGSAVYFEKDGASFDTPSGDFSELVSSGGGWKRIYPNGDTVTFNSSGRMTEFSPLYGPDNSVSYSYGTAGELTHMDPRGSSSISTYLVHEGDSITVQEGEKNGVGADIYRATILRLNGSGRVTSIEGPDGNDELSFTYSGGRISAVTDRRAETSDFSYDDLGYLESVELPQISVGGQNVRPKIEQQSLALTIGPDSTSGEGTSSNPASPVTIANVKPWVEDAKDARTHFTLDKFGAPLKIEEPLGRTTTITRNIHSQVTRVDRPSGAYSTTSWSGPRLTGMFESTTGHTVLYEYASPPESNFNQPVRMHDNQGNREVWYGYDANDRLSTVYLDTIGGPQLASFTYRPDGQLTSRTDSDGGHLVTYEYDTYLDYENVNAVNRIRGTDTLTTRFESDDYGRRVMTVNPAGDTTHVSYDDLDRMQWSVNAMGDTTHFDHDAYLLDKVTDAEGQVYETTPNALGWPTVTHHPAGDSTMISYDANGNVTSATDRLGNIGTFGYDSLNLARWAEVEGDTISFWTDPDGLKTAAWNTVSADTTEFDTAGRRIKQIIRRGSNLSRRYVIRTKYYDDGRLWKTWVSGTIDYEIAYDWTDEGLLSRVTDRVPATPVHTRFGYNDHYQVDTVRIGGTDRWRYFYSSFHPLGHLAYESSALDDAFGFGLDLDEELLRIKEVNWADGDTTRSIAYDEIGQVTAVVDSFFTSQTCEWDEEYGEICTGGGPPSELSDVSFDYDPVGNPVGATVTDGNRMTGYLGYTFTHDDEGRTLTKSKAGFSQTYHWNDRSQVDSVTTIESGDTTVVHYTYDGLGRRITRDGPGGFEEYIYDGDHVIVVLDDNQNVLRTFSYYPGVDRPHSLMTDSATYYYATDPTGSVSGLAEFDGGSTVVNHYRYDVWGMPQGTVTEGVDSPIRFKARWWDADTELLDFRNRWYDPEIGRFISEDPIGIAGGINVYRFVGNDPVSGWDPYGLAEDWVCRWETISITTVSGLGEGPPEIVENKEWVCNWVPSALPVGPPVVFYIPLDKGTTGEWPDPPESSISGETAVTVVELGLAAGQLASCRVGGAMRSLGRSRLAGAAFGVGAFIGVLLSPSAANVGADIDGSEFLDRTTARPPNRIRIGQTTELREIAGAADTAAVNRIDDVTQRLRYRADRTPRC